MRYRALQSEGVKGGDSDGRKTVLLTLGRLPVALDLARGFEAAGWRVIVAEPFAMHLCRMSRSVAKSRRVTAPLASPQQYRSDLLRIIREDAIDLVVPVSEERHGAARGPDGQGKG